MAKNHGVHTVYGALSECFPYGGKAKEMTWDVIADNYNNVFHNLNFEKDLDSIIAPFLPVSSKGKY